MVFYGLLCLTVFLIASWAYRTDKPNHADAVGASMLLCLSFGVSNLVVGLYGWPDALLFFPALDLLIAFMVWRAWKRRRRAWKAILCSLLVAQMCLHVATTYAWKDGSLSLGGLYLYVVAINVLFVGQLLAVGFPGVRYGVGYVRSRLSHHRLGIVGENGQ